jgi:DNA helicase-2/ATP-dependent DNA helicase PcrA
MSHRGQNWTPRGVATLEPEAEKVVRSMSNALVVAGPGAGKTELLSQRACYLLESGICPQPKLILALSYKRDAAHNLRERVKLRCGTRLARRFESTTYAAWVKGLLDRFRHALPPAYRPTSDYRITSDGKDFREQLLKLESGTYQGLSQYEVSRLTDAEVKNLYQTQVLDVPVSQPAPGEWPSLIQAWWHHMLHGQESSVLSFALIEVLVEFLIRTNPSLRTMLWATYCYVFLDEFQDTTHPQYRVLKAAFHDSSAVLTAVGDNKQCIMRWANAYAKVFDAFETEFNAPWHRLVMNYRSAPWLVKIQGHLALKLDPKSPTPEAAEWNGEHEGECHILTFDDHQAEAIHMAQLIANWVRLDGISPADICIISRTAKPTDCTEVLREELKKLGVRSRRQDELQELLVEPLTTAVVSALRLCTHRQHPDSWQHLSTLFLRLRGLYEVEDKEHKARQSATELTAFLKQLTIQMTASQTMAAMRELIFKLLDFLNEVAFCELYERYTNVDNLYRIIDQCAIALAHARAQTSNWEEALDELAGVYTIPVMSIHKSKGLEYHTVVFVGLEDYQFRGYGNGNAIEEDSNFFVAFSRAKARVLLTFSEYRPNAAGRMIQQYRKKVESIYDLLEQAGVYTERFEANI